MCISAFAIEELHEDKAKQDESGNWIFTQPKKHTHSEVYAGCKTKTETNSWGISVAGTGISGGGSTSTTTCWAAPQDGAVQHYHDIPEGHTSDIEKGLDTPCETGKMFKVSVEVDDQRFKVRKRVGRSSARTWVTAGKVIVTYLGGGCVDV